MLILPRISFILFCYRKESKLFFMFVFVFHTFFCFWDHCSLQWRFPCSSAFSWTSSTHHRKSIWLKVVWCSMAHALSSVPYANNTKHMLFLAAWQDRSCYSWMFCEQLCTEALGVSCYQCRDRRYSSCFNCAPYVPLDPSQLTWCEQNHSSFFIPCQLGHTFCFVCLSCCFSFQK